jgi:pilus assembly protein CpaB
VSRARRAVLLGALALLLGGLAASDVAEREAALERRLGPPVTIVVARSEIAPGDELTARRLAVRRVPARYAPRGAFASAAEVAGARAATGIAAGSDISAAQLEGSGASQDALAGAAPGERVARIVAVGVPEELAPGARVDVLITEERAGGRVRTRLAPRAAVVVESRPAPAGEGDGLPRVALALRVSLQDAVQLAQAQAGARELRVLARPSSASRRVR